jgi:hypothetical protein
LKQESLESQLFEHWSSIGWLSNPLYLIGAFFLKIIIMIVEVESSSLYKNITAFLIYIK